MVKYAVWSERTSDEVDPLLHKEIVRQAAEQGHQISRCNAAWKRDAGHSVEISTEFRPGYRPIWLWEVK